MGLNPEPSRKLPDLTAMLAIISVLLNGALNV